MILLFLAAAAAQPQADTPRGFVTQLYARYRAEDFNPLERPRRLFAPPLAEAIEEDARLARGEVGYLNGDPLCDCQDYERISARITAYQRLTPGMASVRVHVDLGLKETRDLRLSLVRTGAGWRIADIVGSDGKSLLGELRRSNRERR